MEKIHDNGCLYHGRIAAPCTFGECDCTNTLIRSEDQYPTATGKPSVTKHTGVASDGYSSACLSDGACTEDIPAVGISLKAGWTFHKSRYFVNLVSNGRLI